MRVAISLPRAAIDRLWPPVPAALRDDYALSQYRRLTRQMPLLHLALMLIVAATLEATNPDAPALIRHGIPLAVLIACLARLLIWARRTELAPSAAFARRKIAGMAVFSSMVAVAASIWCVQNWFTAPHASALFYPMLMVLGEIATVICMIPIRTAAYANLILGIGPIAIALGTWGDSFEKTMALAIATTGTFLIGMLRHQHGEVIERLALEQQMIALAETDALTSLGNRRALERSFSGLSGATSALILIDLDKFKPINDRHGHEVGDAVLIKVAARLRGAVCSDGLVCRLGGDEFAVLLHGATHREAERMAGTILAALAKPVMVQGNPLAIGASLGIGRGQDANSSLAGMLGEADAAMYRSKRGEDNLARLVQPVRKACVMG